MKWKNPFPNCGSIPEQLSNPVLFPPFPSASSLSLVPPPLSLLFINALNRTPGYNLRQNFSEGVLNKDSNTRGINPKRHTSKNYLNGFLGGIRWNTLDTFVISTKTTPIRLLLAQRKMRIVPRVLALAVFISAFLSEFTYRLTVFKLSLQTCTGITRALHKV